MPSLAPTNWPSARQFAEAIQCPGLCFINPHLRDTLPAVDRLGMPLVTSGQFAYVYKLKPSSGGAFAVRCFRGHLGDRERRYQLIDEHLRRERIPALASFGYEPQGILVNGRRFPILAMEWIEGPTLDVYLGEAVKRKEALLHLADEWLRLMQALRAAGVAHGDLQHGNIIVERGALRLVDLDGMFVPAMSGWQACEMGHQHYQHPARDALCFDANLDNFSALVVYLSLISLAERPELWTEHHDENLIFTKADFNAPGESALFRKIKEIGPEHRKLAEALETAARSCDPARAPLISELASRKVKGKLPSWMSAPPDIEVAGRTREATAAEAAALKASVPQPVNWQWRRPKRSPTTTPGSSTVQSVFSGTAQTAQGLPPAVYTPADPHDVGTNALFYSRRLLKQLAPYWWMVFFLRWFPLGFWALFGVPEGAALILTVMLLIAIVLSYGLARAIQDSRAANTRLNLTGGASAALPSSSSASTPLPYWVWNAPTISAQAAPAPSLPATAPPPPPPMTAVRQGLPFTGHRTLGIYHLRDCEWAQQISKQNSVGFRSKAAAQYAGYRPCKVCAP
ncbi:MAG TPA: Ada metal-binding domain-containing protein [Pyrinomonadaceae bacterium]